MVSIERSSEKRRNTVQSVLEGNYLRFTDDAQEMENAPTRQSPFFPGSIT